MQQIQPIQEIEELKSIMEKEGLSQEKVARELQVSVFSVSRWLAYKNRPIDMAMIRIREFIKNHKKSIADNKQ